MKNQAKENMVKVLKSLKLNFENIGDAYTVYVNVDSRHIDKHYNLQVLDVSNDIYDRTVLGFDDYYKAFEVSLALNIIEIFKTINMGNDTILKSNLDTRKEYYANPKIDFKIVLEYN